MFKKSTYCIYKSTYFHTSRLITHILASYCHLLAEDDPLRTDPAFNKTELRGPCKPRTHAQVAKQGAEAENWEGFKKDHPKRLVGVKRLSPLLLVPLFDIVWDITPDMMHIIEGFQKTHLLSLLKCNRRPKAPPTTGKGTKEGDAKYRKRKKDHQGVCAKVAIWELNKAQCKILDKRSLDMGGAFGWIRSNMAITQRTGSLNAHDWVKLIESSYERYVLHDMLDVGQLKALYALYDVMRACMRATGEGQDEATAKEQISQLKVAVIRALCLWVLEAPRTELSTVLHILGHVPDAIYRWGSPRNYWAFFGERYISPPSLLMCFK